MLENLYNVDMNTEKDFNPVTMSIATQADFDRMYGRLWGNGWTSARAIFYGECGEYLDLIQITYLFEEMKR